MHCQNFMIYVSRDKYYFYRSMFGGLMKESLMNNVTIFGVAPDVMEILIEFCYTGVAVICENNVVDLLKAADLLQV